MDCMVRRGEKVSMRCPRVQYLYDEYVAGTLDHKTAEVVDLHLAECGECRDYFQTNDDLAELIFEGNEVVHPGEPYLQSLSERVLSNIQTSSSGEFDRLRLMPVRAINPWRRPLWWIGAAAAVALVVLGIQRDPEVNLPRELAALNQLEASLPPEQRGHAATESNSSAGFDASAAASSRDFSTTSEFTPTPVRDAIEPVASGNGAGGRSGQPVVTASPANRYGKAISKSVTHPDRASAEDMDSREKALSVFSNSVTPSETPRTMIRPPSPEPQAAPPIAPELIEEIIVLDAIGTPEARERIYGLMESAGRSPETGLNELIKMADPELLRQWSLFSQAEAAYRENRAELALKTFVEVTNMNAESVLGLRAHLRIADLRYQGWADFEQAQESYARCMSPKANRAFTRQEFAHIERRSNMIGRYAAVGWEPLKIMHVIAHNPWPDATLALENLARGTEAAQLMPEAAQMIIARLQRGQAPSETDSNKMLSALSMAAVTMENRAAQAWLALAMGEIYLVALQNQESALNAYQSVVELDPQSAPADHARQRQYQIRTQALQSGSR